MAAVLRVVLLVLGVSHCVAGLPHAKRGGACTTKTQRKPWQNLTDTEKSGYLNATLCLMTSPAKNNIPRAKTRWDELQYAHVVQSDYIHRVGAFLPWHRYFLNVHEDLLRNECGYTGSMPYWNEVLDVKNLKGSPIFDAKLGFGGDGRGWTRCVADGPFANLTLRFLADLSTTKYCITRNINNCFFKGAGQENLDICFAKTNFVDATNCWEGQPHGAGHGSVGGLMVNIQLSPGDPLFYLHHTYLDRLWWMWQTKDLPKRLTEMGGPNIPQPLFPAAGSNQTFSLPPGFGPPRECFAGLGGNVSFPFPFPATNGTFNGSNPVAGILPGAAIKENFAITRYFNDGGDVTTLNHTLWSAGIYPNATIGDVMDINGPLVCAEYL